MSFYTYFVRWITWWVPEQSLDYPDDSEVILKVMYGIDLYRTTEIATKWILQISWNVLLWVNVWDRPALLCCFSDVKTLIHIYFTLINIQGPFIIKISQTSEWVCMSTICCLTLVHYKQMGSWTRYRHHWNACCSSNIGIYDVRLKYLICYTIHFLSVHI